ACNDGGEDGTICRSSVLRKLIMMISRSFSVNPLDSANSASVSQATINASISRPCSVNSIVAVSNSGHSPFNLFFRLLPALLLETCQATTHQCRNGHIFARKELAGGDDVELVILDLRRAGSDIPMISVPSEFDLNICSELFFPVHS